MLLKKQEQISRLGALSRRRDIIAEYGDYGSQAFAPLTKLGLYPDRCQRKFSVQSRFLNSYRGTYDVRRSRFTLLVCLSPCAAVGDVFTLPV